jgi:hypothetical protein
MPFLTFLLFNVIDKQFAQQVVELQMQKSREFLLKVGQSQDKVDEAMKSARDSNQMSFKKILLGMGISIIWDFIIGLLIALCIRKEEKFND